MKNRYNQGGFSLFIVMVIMLVIALLVIATSQSSNTEMRMSTNEADRKYAVSLAEQGLLDAEAIIKNWANSANQTARPNLVFKSDCADGLCAPEKDTYVDNQDVLFKYDSKGTQSTIPAWERCQSNTNTRCEINKGSVLDKSCNKAPITCKAISGTDTRYVIEYLGNKTDAKLGNVDYFRVTSRAHGNNKDTVVTLQTYLELLNKK
ncbi:PilX N-terminal domain-containing pilus assembly protein [Kingella oralis]|jgi:hypothetical protein|uniref:pilus assembly PilX family protein n=1 Tax=Kingella oralis TaxID=505 RepID=UPI0009D77ABF|nr:PilX N-terminal domain-containing pilus assembly protein [Kingella oralis]QMT43704.1 hypothetical protein H3L93_05105 [Kingella oralis]RKW31220.1 MAG: hypothetical protein D8B42_04300 [Kingella sp. (in: b-proteobacteria)]